MRTLRSNPRLRGVVLAEMLMASFITGLLFTVLPGFYFAYLKVWSRESSRMAGVERADIVLQRMEKEVRNARSLTLSSSGDALTILLPRQHYDASVGRPVNDVDDLGRLVDGDRIYYYYVTDPHGTGGNEGGVLRRVQRADGTALTPKLIADQIHPQLNPLATGTSTPRPVFAYNATLRTVAVTVAAAESKPSRGNFAPTRQAPRCSRDGGSLIRVATTQYPEGEIRCSRCGTRVQPNVEIVTHQIQLLVRNK